MPPSRRAPEEVRMRQLAKENPTCPNCHTHNPHGFGTVCLKFHTFVCNMCKTSHQAVSHRCKSISMSTWNDPQEVAMFEGGANAKAEATWLANAPPVGQNGRPQQGSPVETFKRFVIQAYEHKQYYNPNGVPAPTTTESTSAPLAPPPTRTSYATKPAPRIQKVAPVQQPAPAPSATDFLDFASFPSTEPIPAPSWDAFAPTATNAASSTPRVAPPPSSHHDPFAPVAPTSSNTTSNPASSAVATSTAQPMKKPIMGGAGSNNISQLMSQTHMSSSSSPNGTNGGKQPQSHQSNTIQLDAFATAPTHHAPSTSTAGRMSSVNAAGANPAGMMSMSGLNPSMMNSNMMTMMMNQQNNGGGMMNQNFGGGGMMVNNNHNGMMMNGGMQSSNFNGFSQHHQQPVMSYHNGSTAISNMTATVPQQRQHQNKKANDAFSDLVNF